jgi:hypothetical protein
MGVYGFPFLPLDYSEYTYLISNILTYLYESAKISFFWILGSICTLIININQFKDTVFDTFCFNTNTSNLNNPSLNCSSSTSIVLDNLNNINPFSSSDGSEKETFKKILKTVSILPFTTILFIKVGVLYMFEWVYLPQSYLLTFPHTLDTLFGVESNLPYINKNSFTSFETKFLKSTFYKDLKFMKAKVFTTEMTSFLIVSSVFTLTENLQTMPELYKEIIRSLVTSLRALTTLDKNILIIDLKNLYLQILKESLYIPTHLLSDRLISQILAPTHLSINSDSYSAKANYYVYNKGVEELIARSHYIAKFRFPEDADLDILHADYIYNIGATYNCMIKNNLIYSDPYYLLNSVMISLAFSSFIFIITKGCVIM